MSIQIGPANGERVSAPNGQDSTVGNRATNGARSVNPPPNGPTATTTVGASLNGSGAAQAVRDLHHWLIEAEADLTQGKSPLPATPDPTEPSISQRSLALLAAIMVSTSDAVVTSDARGGITTWNPAAERLFGYTAAEAIGHPFTLITPVGDDDEGRDFLMGMVAEGADLCAETKRRRKDGTLVDVEMTISAIRDPGGAILGYSSIARDISARKTKEHKLRDMELQFRSFFESMPGLTYIALPRSLAPRHGVLHLSQQFVDLTGYSPAAHGNDLELLDNVVHPGDRDQRIARHRAAEESGEPFRLEYRIITSDGRVAWVREWALLLYGEEGEPRCWLGFMLDISDQKRLEAALAASDVRFRTVFANAPIGMALVSPDLQILQANHSFCIMLGYTEAELLTKTIPNITHLGDLATGLEEIELALRGEQTTFQLEKRYVRKDGQVVWGQLSATLVRDEAGAPDYFIAQIQDISDRKAAEAERGATHQQIREVLERVTDGFIAVDREWRFTYLNETARRILGGSLEDFQGTTVWEAFPPARETPVYTATHQAMVEGIATDFELFYPPFDGWFAGRVYPSPAGLSIFFRDVSDQRLAETGLAKMVAELQATNRELELLSDAKSDFVSMISHEFRTPLTSIQGFSELLIDEELPPRQMRDFAITINENALRLARMIGDVLDLARMEAGQAVLRHESTDLNWIVEHVVASLQPTAPRHRFLTRLDPALPPLWCDPDLIVRVVTNLVANAIKYAPAGGDLVLTTGHSSDLVDLTVSDQGLGVPTEHRESIFSRYGRIARPEQAGIEGTGLGLPIARQIVELHRGRIWVEDNIPAGSAFRVELPTNVPAPLPAD